MAPCSFFLPSWEWMSDGASQLHILTDNRKQPAVGKFNFTYLINSFNESPACARRNKTSHTVGGGMFPTRPSPLRLLDDLDALMLPAAVVPRMRPSLLLFWFSGWSCRCATGNNPKVLTKISSAVSASSFFFFFQGNSAWHFLTFRKAAIDFGVQTLWYYKPSWSMRCEWSWPYWTKSPCILKGIIIKWRSKRCFER